MRIACAKQTGEDLSTLREKISQAFQEGLGASLDHLVISIDLGHGIEAAAPLPYLYQMVLDHDHRDRSDLYVQERYWEVVRKTLERDL